jgi:hypothetical protein
MMYLPRKKTVPFFLSPDFIHKHASFLFNAYVYHLAASVPGDKNGKGCYLGHFNNTLHTFSYVRRSEDLRRTRYRLL